MKRGVKIAVALVLTAVPGVVAATYLGHVRLAATTPSSESLASAGARSRDSRRASELKLPPPHTSASAVPEPARPSGTAKDCPKYSYASGMASGRRLASEKHYADAARAYDEAVRARPFDAQARAERAYVNLLRGEGSADEMELAFALATSDKLQAEIAYNLGLLFDKKGDSESARRAFVRAERLGSRQATKKLGKASRCTVTVKSSAKTVRVVKGWKAVLQKLAEYCAKPPQPRSLPEIRAYACGKCDLQHTWHKGVCSKKGPWEFTDWTSDDGVDTTLIQPLAGGLFYLGRTYDNSHLPDPRLDPSLHPIGRAWVLVTKEQEPLVAGEGYFNDGSKAEYLADDGWDDQFGKDGLPNYPCLHGAAPDVAFDTANRHDYVWYVEGQKRQYYDRRGKPLATVELGPGDADRVKIRLKAQSLAVTGGGCQLSVPLAAGP